MLETRRGPKILEINSSPGLEGIEKATGKDVAGAIVKHAERYAKKRRGRGRGAFAGRDGQALEEESGRPAPRRRSGAR
jgi:ribosomal protein S6--L-glutamate ligase